ncbi:hypothetical protein [Halioxenophilus sp. WMMB6]|uniref:hypothetical protein n=1 Tax=Halioxenophilus sp. WMMB6 TaxID=3073815 RepID=UPI00295ECFFD|nr:hypothetical protein [Halioxenophilus sp. WMMB6]
MTQRQTLSAIASTFLSAIDHWGHIPAITGIDLGLAPERDDEPQLALRIHLQHPADQLWLHDQRPLPAPLLGIPIYTLHGLYQAATEADTNSHAISKRRISTAGLGQWLLPYLQQQNPLQGRTHRVLARSSQFWQTGFEIISPSAPQASRLIYKAIQNLEASHWFAGHTSTALHQAPGAGGFAGNSFDLHLKGASAHAQACEVDGLGLYASQGDAQAGLTPGIRLRPAKPVTGTHPPL